MGARMATLTNHKWRLFQRTAKASTEVSSVVMPVTRASQQCDIT